MTQLSMFEPIELPLTKGYVALIDPVDADLLDRKWHANVQGNRVYALSHRNNKSLKLHRVIFERIISRALLPNELVDHMDNNPLNNRRNNLRLTDRVGNRANAKVERTNKSGYKGVWQRGNTWYACIKCSGKTFHLGQYDTPEAAHQAYVTAAQKYFGEFARSA